MAEETHAAVSSWSSLAAVLHERDGVEDLKLRSWLGFIFQCKAFCLLDFSMTPLPVRGIPVE